MSLDFDALRSILVCPKTHAALVTDGQSLVSVDPDTRLRYEIRDGIPIMLVDEAELPEGAEGISEEPPSGGTS